MDVLSASANPVQSGCLSPVRVPRRIALPERNRGVFHGIHNPYNYYNLFLSKC